MRMMSDVPGQNRAPADLPVILAAQEAERFSGVGRNDVCPCGSGAKFKKCHGASSPAG